MVKMIGTKQKFKSNEYNLLADTVQENVEQPTQEKMQVCCLLPYTSNWETRCHWYPLGLLSLLFSLTTDQLCPEGSVGNETSLASNNRKIFITFVKGAWVIRKAEKIEPWLNSWGHLPKAHCRIKPPRALLPLSLLGSFQQKRKSGRVADCRTFCLCSTPH